MNSNLFLQNLTTHQPWWFKINILSIIIKLCAPQQTHQMQQKVDQKKEQEREKWKQEKKSRKWGRKEVGVRNVRASECRSRGGLVGETAAASTSTRVQYWQRKGLMALSHKQSASVTLADCLLKRIQTRPMNKRKSKLKQLDHWLKTNIERNSEHHFLGKLWLWRRTWMCIIYMCVSVYMHTELQLQTDWMEKKP